MSNIPSLRHVNEFPFSSVARPWAAGANLKKTNIWGYNIFN